MVLVSRSIWYSLVQHSSTGRSGTHRSARWAIGWLGDWARVSTARDLDRMLFLAYVCGSGYGLGFWCEYRGGCGCGVHVGVSSSRFVDFLVLHTLIRPPARPSGGRTRRECPDLKRSAERWMLDDGTKDVGFLSSNGYTFVRGNRLSCLIRPSARWKLPAPGSVGICPPSASSTDSRRTGGRWTRDCASFV